MINLPKEAPLTEYLHRKAVARGIPLSGTFELTPCCNMACRMCYVRKTKEEQEAIAPLKSAADWLNLAREGKKHGLLYLLLTGGEPFLRPDFREILGELHREGFIISINSNGTMIDERVMEWLVKTPPMRVNITLYGASDETYARLCMKPDGFTRATRAIRLLRDAGIGVKINCSLTPENAADLHGIFGFAHEEGIPVQATSYMFPPIRRNEDIVGYNEGRFTPEEAAYQAACILCEQKGEDWFLEMMKQNAPVQMPDMLEEDCDGEGDGLRCRAGKCSFWITWDGRMLPCGMLPASEGIDVFRTGFLPSWEEVKTRTAQVRLPKGCAVCEARDQCKACAAMVYSESGTFSKVPRYRCEMTREYPAACRRLEQEILERRMKHED